MNNVDEMLDDLDAAVFTGNYFHASKQLDQLNWYLKRWKKEALEIEKTLEDYIDDCN
jgi:hypothetical protein